MIQKFLKALLFKPEDTATKLADPRTYPCDGLNAFWFDHSTLHVCGWTQPRPRVGDFLTCEMTSGRMGRFVFVKVELCNDPHDMYFGYVKHDGYIQPPPATSEGSKE